MGSLRYIPLEPICIRSLSACTFPVQVIIYIKHYLYSCIFSIRKRVMSTRTSKRLTHFTCVEKTKVKQVVRIIAAVLKRHSSKSLIPSCVMYRSIRGVININWNVRPRTPLVPVVWSSMVFCGYPTSVRWYPTACTGIQQRALVVCCAQALLKTAALQLLSFFLPLLLREIG